MRNIQTRTQKKRTVIGVDISQIQRLSTCVWIGHPPDGSLVRERPKDIKNKYVNVNCPSDLKYLEKRKGKKKKIVKIETMFHAAKISIEHQKKYSHAVKANCISDCLFFFSRIVFQLLALLLRNIL